MSKDVRVETEKPSHWPEFFFSIFIYIYVYIFFLFNKYLSHNYKYNF